MMEPVVIVAVAVGVPLLIVLIWAVATFNRFVGLRQHLRESWADIEVELKRRHELIPNLVEVVRGYASHEREVMERVVRLRNKAVDDARDAAALAAHESELMRGVARLFAVAEAYPDLKADAMFRSLSEQLADTEDRIAASRRFYNANVRDLNRLREMFPTSIIASMMGVPEARYFELASDAERVVPRISL